MLACPDFQLMLQFCWSKTANRSGAARYFSPPAIPPSHAAARRVEMKGVARMTPSSAPRHRGRCSRLLQMRTPPTGLSLLPGFAVSVVYAPLAASSSFHGCCYPILRLYTPPLSWRQRIVEPMSRCASLRVLFLLFSTFLDAPTHACTPDASSVCRSITARCPAAPVPWRADLRLTVGGLFAPHRRPRYCLRTVAASHAPIARADLLPCTCSMDGRSTLVTAAPSS
ncbi:hypothetical protein C8R45DRAFT_545650 [Mycena sanguinolenta]|nr:hypothetical protein C8R45DRAFT_545650 [Mycena sanguinolenta]